MNLQPSHPGLPPQRRNLRLRASTTEAASASSPPSARSGFFASFAGQVSAVVGSFPASVVALSGAMSAS